MDFGLPGGGSAPLTPALFKGQLSIFISSYIKKNNFFFFASFYPLEGGTTPVKNATAFSRSSLAKPHYMKFSFSVLLMCLAVSASV